MGNFILCSQCTLSQNGNLHELFNTAISLKFCLFDQQNIAIFTAKVFFVFCFHEKHETIICGEPFCILSGNFRKLQVKRVKVFLFVMLCSSSAQNIIEFASYSFQDESWI